MYTNAQGQIVEDQSTYTGADGTKYPWNFPKDKIAELTPVKKTVMPKDEIVTGFKVVDGIQVWETRKKTAQEAENDIKDQINALEAQQTKRRERDAILTEDGKKWIETLEAQIDALRLQLRGL